jgi:membrane-associated protease RseP (regulator of RpoE activity)
VIDEHETLPPNSDYFSFYQKKIPVIALFTGLHKDYHRATDTADKIVAGTMEKIVRVAFDTTLAVTRADEKPAFGKCKPGGEAEEMFEQLQVMLSDDDLKSIFGGEDGMNKLFKEGGLSKVMEKLRGTSGKARFGVQLDQEAEVDGVKVSSVTKGSLAEKAGVQKGDVILAIGERETGDLDTLRIAIRRAQGRTKVIVLRGEEKVELEADFPVEGQPAAPEKRWF